MSEPERTSEPERQRLRQLVGQTPKVAAPEDVDVPEWAAGFEIGERLGFWVGDTQRTYVQPIVGFSTMDDHTGMPVVRAPEALDTRVKHLAIPKSRILEPGEVLDDGE